MKAIAQDRARREQQLARLKKQLIAIAARKITMSRTIHVSHELARLFGPNERLPQTFTEAVVLELFREHHISAGKASELLELPYREFLDLLQSKNIPIMTTSPRDPHEEKIRQYDTGLETP
jgi:predicted HTH domain antitoxin